MPEVTQETQFPNQLFGWVLEEDGTWSLYSETGVLVFSTLGGFAQVSPPVADDDVANKGYVDTHGGGGSQTLAQVLALGNDAGGLRIEGLDDPEFDQDAATKAYVDAAASSQTLAAVLAEGNNADGLRVTGLADGEDPQDAATVAQLGGGSSPFLDRAPAGDVTIPDHYSAVAVDYYQPSGALILEGDAVLLVVEGDTPSVASGTPFGLALIFGGGDSAPGGASGPAGGDLGGVYPDPSVVAVNGVVISGVPSSGQVPVASGAAAAAWGSLAAFPVAAFVDPASATPEQIAQSLIDATLMAAS